MQRERGRGNFVFEGTNALMRDPVCRSALGVVDLFNRC